MCRGQGSGGWAAGSLPPWPRWGPTGASTALTSLLGWGAAWRISTARGMSDSGQGRQAENPGISGQWHFRVDMLSRTF